MQLNMNTSMHANQYSKLVVYCLKQLATKSIKNTSETLAMKSMSKIL